MLAICAGSAVTMQSIRMQGSQAGLGSVHMQGSQSGLGSKRSGSLARQDSGASVQSPLLQGPTSATAGILVQHLNGFSEDWTFVLYSIWSMEWFRCQHMVA